MATGTYKVDELSAQDSVIKDLDIGTHFIENTSAGTIALQSKQAYGTWEWDMRNNNNPLVNFISTLTSIVGTDAYYLTFFGTERIQLGRYDFGSAVEIATTATNYIVDNTWYRLKVARLQSEGVFKDIGNGVVYPANSFAVFIKGGSFGNIWTLVDITGGSKTNPVVDATYTTSEFFVADLDAGDKFTNLRTQTQVEQ